MSKEITLLWKRIHELETDLDKANRKIKSLTDDLMTARLRRRYYEGIEHGATEIVKMVAERIGNKE